MHTNTQTDRQTGENVKWTHELGGKIQRLSPLYREETSLPPAPITCCRLLFPWKPRSWNQCGTTVNRATFTLLLSLSLTFSPSFSLRGEGVEGDLLNWHEAVLAPLATRSAAALCDVTGLVFLFFFFFMRFSFFVFFSLLSFVCHSVRFYFFSESCHHCCWFVMIIFVVVVVTVI